MARKLRPTEVHQSILMLFLCCVMLLGTAWAQEAKQVTSSRDDRGVWFIEGADDATLYDMFEAMGYAVATDRLWQAELYRRQARGRLAELFGEESLPTDIFMRTIGYTQAELTAGYEALSQEAKEVVDGYVDGFNRRIHELREDASLVPFEFTAIGHFPEDWSPADILAWLALLQRNFDPEALDTAQLDNLKLLQYLRVVDPGQAWGMFEDLRWTNDADADTYFDPHRRPRHRSQTAATAAIETQALAQTAFRLSAERKAMFAHLEKLNARVRMGSYAWVVAGKHTRSGNPILYSGPQMGFSVPSIVAEGSLRGAGMEISGMTVPGIPAIIIGRTPHHAWSMQVGHAHTTDYYFDISTDADAITLERVEAIRVAGGDTINLPVYFSKFGPVIDPLLTDLSQYAFTGANPIVSWRYAHRGHEFKSIDGFLALARAESMDEFGAGIEEMAVSQHFCYADREGNIAYWMSGRNPMRYAGEWRLPQGSLPDVPVGEWVEGELVPRSTDHNTPKGYYAGWNNKTQPDYDNAYNSIGDIYGPFHRSHVIYDYLDRRLKKRHGKKLSFEELRDLALNIATTDSLGGGGNPWDALAPYFTKEIWRATWQRGDWRQKIARLRALRLLQRWDGHFLAGGAADWADGPDRADAWMLMDAWVHEALRLTFGDELGAYLSHEGADSLAIMAAKDWPSGERRVLINVLLHALGRRSDIVNEYDWFQNLGEGPSGARKIIVAALDNALDYLGERPWGVGERGWINYQHPILAKIMPDPILWQTPFASRSTYAHVVEMGPEGPERIESMFPLGESGNISVSPDGRPVLDDSFFSMTDRFDAFETREFPLFD